MEVLHVLQRPGLLQLCAEPLDGVLQALLGAHVCRSATAS
jgi:hypothetical protein